MASEKKIYPKFKAVAKGGRLYLEDEAQFSEYLVMLEGKNLHVIAKPATKDRSRQEEKYYHAVVVNLIAQAMDIMPQEAHDFLKRMFLLTEERTTSGIRYERVQSTTELSDTAYREYWTKCVNWAALPTSGSGLGHDSGLNLYIPMPNEVDYSSY